MWKNVFSRGSPATIPPKAFFGFLSHHFTRIIENLASYNLAVWWLYACLSKLSGSHRCVKAKVILLHAVAHSNQVIQDHCVGRENWSSSVCSEASLYIVADLDQSEAKAPEHDTFLKILSKGGDDGSDWLTNTSTPARTFISTKEVRRFKWLMMQ